MTFSLLNPAKWLVLQITNAHTSTYSKIALSFFKCYFLSKHFFFCFPLLSIIHLVLSALLMWWCFCILYFEYTESLDMYPWALPSTDSGGEAKCVRAAVWMLAITQWLRALWSSSSLAIVLKRRNSTALQGCSHTRLSLSHFSPSADWLIFPCTLI